MSYSPVCKSKKNKSNSVWLVGTELDCHNIAEAVKSKSFAEMSYEEKFEFVNKEIDDLLDFIERNKQVKYNKWRKEISIWRERDTLNLLCLLYSKNQAVEQAWYINSLMKTDKRVIYQGAWNVLDEYDDHYYKEKE